MAGHTCNPSTREAEAVKKPGVNLDYVTSPWPAYITETVSK